jgi:hypothetical protein
MELPEIPPEERTPLVEAWLGISRPLGDRVQELEQTVPERRQQKPRELLAGSARWATRLGDQRDGSGLLG